MGLPWPSAREVGARSHAGARAFVGWTRVRPRRSLRPRQRGGAGRAESGSHPRRQARLRRLHRRGVLRHPVAKFARSLEQSVLAIAEIRRGNLDVALDDSGKDEVAAVARSFNQLVAVLKETEFLEKINADLRARSTRLATTLEALQTAQADLVRSERMASVAVLVKGIAHELNNPINYIAGNIAPLRRYCEFLSLAATELSDGRERTPAELRRLTHLTESKDLSFVASDLSRLTADIGEGARRAHLIISDLQSLTAAAQRGVEQVNLHRVVRQTISLLHPSVPPGVNLEAISIPFAFSVRAPGSSSRCS